jgi:hypothetical protein
VVGYGPFGFVKFWCVWFGFGRLDVVGYGAFGSVKFWWVWFGFGR